MNFKEYQKQAKRTCPTLGSVKLDLAHMALGVFSEFGEFLNATDEVNKAEECADICWYLANYCTFRGLDLQDLFTYSLDSGSGFAENVSKLQDFVKKYIAYNKPIDEITETDLLSKIAFNVQKMFGTIDFYQSLQNNIDKLKIRFPNKFTEDLAKNRDLEAERKELEK